jgi:hypothetical protein
MHVCTSEAAHRWCMDALLQSQPLHSESYLSYFKSACESLAVAVQHGSLDSILSSDSSSRFPSLSPSLSLTFPLSHLPSLSPSLLLSCLGHFLSHIFATEFSFSWGVLCCLLALGFHLLDPPSSPASTQRHRPRAHGHQITALLDIQI